MLYTTRNNHGTKTSCNKPQTRATRNRIALLLYYMCGARDTTSVERLKRARLLSVMAMDGKSKYKESPRTNDQPRAASILVCLCCMWLEYTIMKRNTIYNNQHFYWQRRIASGTLRRQLRLEKKKTTSSSFFFIIYFFWKYRLV